jgi:prolyl 4-hydroxylase
MDERWKNWVKENVERGCNHDDMRKIMLDNKLSIANIDAELNPLIRQPGPRTKVLIDHAALATIRITRNAKPLETDLVQMYVLDDFMSDAECDELIAVSREALVPSAITTQETEPDKYFRTSSTCYISRAESKLVAMIDHRIADTIGIHPSYSEEIQIQRYEVGQEFKAHHDFFTPNTKEWDKYCSVLGNRTWTFMVYLNDVAKGGGTEFTELGETFYPKRGMALVWNNLYADGTTNPFTKHWGLPVEEGFKVVITKWFREHGHTLPKNAHG